MKNKSFILITVFFVVFCVSAFAGAKKDSSAKSSPSRYLFEQNFAKNDISRVIVEGKHVTDYYPADIEEHLCIIFMKELGYYSYIPNIGFSAGKRVIYNGSIALLDYIIPDSALAVLTKDELQLLRNTIYAKHGMIFQSNDLKTHFQQFKWYNPINNKVEERLSKTDIANIENIQVFENAQPNHNLTKREIIEKGETFFIHYSGKVLTNNVKNIILNNGNTIEWNRKGEDNFKGSYKIENGFLVVFVTEQNIGTAKYFLNNNWNWSNDVTYSDGIIKYKEPIRMVFPVGDIEINNFDSYLNNLLKIIINDYDFFNDDLHNRGKATKKTFLKRQQIGSVSWFSSLNIELQNLDLLMQKRAIELSKARYKNTDIEKISLIDSALYKREEVNALIMKNIYRVSLRGNILGLIGYNVEVEVTGQINPSRNSTVQVLEAKIR